MKLESVILDSFESEIQNNLCVTFVIHDHNKTLLYQSLRIRNIVLHCTCFLLSLITITVTQVTK